ncbi:Rieske 2Fe-2S domain-containing protein [Streptomyces sp. NBC_00582]|uniref:Rieske 2Fe-2S domain-containing protein n=1 Tax=Streptomyces sp. NBC_00582 TaxID=2975783 RepID=UPI002E819061|nr:Rieske 2Fe-2S domain-containing protein [Streptomyces sp. NBC_00582]WUB66061.1 Rieske 2Fe-2S domain-containing protein [Streptomyces sp. NBC_00582]
MLKETDNDALCRVGPGTPMGNLMREYWVPVALASELVSGGAPVRILVLGERLIGFRSRGGKPGLIAENCPHRGASLFFARNEATGEEEGLRCVYHGWKFAPDGTCLDMPNEPVESNFKDRVRARTYPCREAGGLVWAYLGPRETPPPMPGFEWFDDTDTPVESWAFQRECNWLQSLEGDIDTSHFGFLHVGHADAEDAPEGSFLRYTIEDRAPRYKVLDTGYGATYGAYRNAGSPEKTYWRFAHFLFPFFTMIPTGVLGTKCGFRAWVPMDDTHTMAFHSEPQGVRHAAPATQGLGITTREKEAWATLPNTPDWYGRFRLAPNKHNDYFIDRDAQLRGDSFTGITGVTVEDQAITESMGGIVDRTHEHLGSADVMVIRVRRRMLRAIAALRDKGTTPPGLDDPTVYRQRSGGIVLPADADWLEATEELRSGAGLNRELDPTVAGGA